MPDEFKPYYAGDTVELEFQLFRDERKKYPWNISDYEIRFELSSVPTSVKKATENVGGGNDSQIKITDGPEGKFIVTLNPDDTKNITPAAYYYEIEITSSTGQKYTVATERLEFKKATITWDSLS